MRRRLAFALLAAAVPTALASLALAEMVAPMELGPPAFDLSGPALGDAKAAAIAPAYLTGSRIFATHAGALVSDADSGAFVRTDAAGKPLGSLAIGRDAGLMTYDDTARRAYVADRRGDRIAVISTADTLAIASSIATPAEPYGVALTPDRKTLLVTTIAARALVAYDTETGQEKWRTDLLAEPRGVAVSPDGTHALVAYVAGGGVDQFELLGADGDPHHANAIELPMDPAPPQPTRKCNKCKPEVVSGPPRYARAAYAVTFMGMHEAVIPFQREQPTQGKDAPVNKGSYGGGFEPPIIEQLAFVRVGEAKPGKVTAQIAQSQPRAIVWDGARDALYVAGLGTDSVQQLRDASTVKISAGTSIQLDTANDKCGPDGLAIDDRGDLLVWCAFSRRVVVVPTAADGKLVAAEVALAPAFGPAVAPTTLTPDQHAGMILFHSAQPAISQRGSLACASCHPDGRADGMTWQIEDHLLQTPILAGRVDGTAPYKWDGTDKDLATSITSTMNRLGGQGLQPDQIAQLAAYVTQLAEPRAPVREAAAVARGKQVFQSSCSSCHDGASYTDRSKHSLQGTLATVDTPSLRGLYASAPYYHDGSAPTLDALLHDQGAVHGMADLSQLTDAQRADLRTYLETL